MALVLSDEALASLDTLRRYAEGVIESADTDPYGTAGSLRPDDGETEAAAHLAALIAARDPGDRDGVERIADERGRQINKWGNEHDDEFTSEELAYAAVTYATPPHERQNHPDLFLEDFWPFPDPPTVGNEPGPAQRIIELERAGALIAAEIDRLRRRQANDGR